MRRSSSWLRSRAGWGCLFVLLVQPPAARAADTDIVINEVFYLGSAGEDWVELKNTGTGTININGWWLCARIVYRQLTAASLITGADLSLDPGEIVTVAAGMDLNGGSSDLGLYTSPAFTSASAMVDFLQWGTSANVGRSNVAATKGIWTQFTLTTYDFVATASAGESVSFCGNSGGGLLTLSSDFVNATPSQGAENPICGLIFADGFESGSTTSWTATVPPP